VDSTEEVRKLLTEIRDAQREHLAEYKRVTQLSLEIQRRSVEHQLRLGRLYRLVVAAGAVVFVGAVACLAYLIARFH
jgi:hypothetical protein